MKIFSLPIKKKKKKKKNVKVLYIVVYIYTFNNRLFHEKGCAGKLTKMCEWNCMLSFKSIQNAVRVNVLADIALL